MSLLNPILTAANAYLLVTNFAGSTLAPGVSQLPGLPLGTGDGTATGEVAVKVVLVGGTISVGAVTQSGTWNIATVTTLSTLSAITGAANLATSQATSTGTAATLVAARPTRRSVLIRNTDTTNSVWVGPATVSTSNGFLIKAGESVPFSWVGLLQIIDNGSGHAVVAVADEYA